MIDGIIEGNGTSRKVFANFPATYEEFRMQAAAGTLQMDVLFNAAGWQQLPTFLNRANLLQGAVAAMFGLDPNAGTVNEALNTIGRLNSGLGNDYLWAKSGPVPTPTPVPGPYNTVDIESTPASPAITISYSSVVAYNQTTGQFELLNPSTFHVPVLTGGTSFQLAIINTMQSLMSDEYIQCEDLGLAEIKRFLHVATGDNAYTIELTYQDISMTEVNGFAGYVNSPYPNAYPPSVSDGFTYAPLGQVGGACRVVFSSYTGNGASTKTLSFSSPPALVVIYRSAIGIGQATSWTFWIRNMTSMNPNVSGQPFISTRFSASGNSLTLTGDSHDMGDDAAATLAMNSNGFTYNVLAVL